MRFGVCLLTACIALASCAKGTDGLPPTQTAGQKEPTAMVRHPVGTDRPLIGSTTRSDCDVQRGLDAIQGFFEALSSGDESRLLSVLAGDGRWEIQIAPDILGAHVGANAAPLSDEPSTTIRGRTELSEFLRSAGKLTFRLSGPLAGGIYNDTDAELQETWRIGIGPLFWDAEGVALSAQGWTRVEGGGKAVVNCHDMRITRVLLSPLSYVR